MSPPEHIGSNTKHHYLHEFSSEIRIIVLSTEEHNATAGLHAATVPWRWLHCMPQHCKKKTSSQAQALRQSNSSHSSGQSLVVACKPILCLLEGVHHWCGTLSQSGLKALVSLACPHFFLMLGHTPSVVNSKFWTFDTPFLSMHFCANRSSPIGPHDVACMEEHLISDEHSSMLLTSVEKASCEITSTLPKKPYCTSAQFSMYTPVQLTGWVESIF